MRHGIVVLLAVVALGGWVSEAEAQSDVAPQPEQGPLILDDVVVDSAPLARQAEAFVGSVSAPIIGRKLAAWKDKICVGAAGLASEPATIMVDRVLDWSHFLGIATSAPGCRPNILIVATNDGRQTARNLVRTHPRDFDSRASGSNEGRKALRAFQEAISPVRWWHVSSAINPSTGLPIVRPRDRPPFAPLVVTRPSDLGNYGRNVVGSRLYDDSVDKLISVVIIVDATVLQDVNLIQLADYVAMIALAQIEPSSTPSAPSILNLFSNQADATPTLSRWDRAYLEALYGSLRTVPPSRDGELVARMMEQRLRREANTSTIRED